MRLPRRRTTPQVVKAVQLEPGERRAAWALTTSGEPVLATDRGLRLPGRPLLEWEQIERAVFGRPTLTVTQLAEVAGTGARHEVDLDLDGVTDLPETVRARITASVAWSSHARLHPTGGVRVVGRRRRGQDALDWQLVFDAGTDPHDPGLRAQAEQHLAAARRSVG